MAVTEAVINTNKEDTTTNDVNTTTHTTTIALAPTIVVPIKIIAVAVTEVVTVDLKASKVETATSKLHSRRTLGASLKRDWEWRLKLLLLCLRLNSPLLLCNKTNPLNNLLKKPLHKLPHG